MPNGVSVLVWKYLVRNFVANSAPMNAAIAPASTSPRMPLPSAPKISGIFSSPASRMIGVASRNENRDRLLVVEAASQPGDHRDARAADAGEQRQHLRRADPARIERTHLGNDGGVDRPRSTVVGAAVFPAAASGAQRFAVVATHR